MLELLALSLLFNYYSSVLIRCFHGPGPPLWLADIIDVTSAHQATNIAFFVLAAWLLLSHVLHGLIHKNLVSLTYSQPCRYTRIGWATSGP